MNFAYIKRQQIVQSCVYEHLFIWLFVLIPIDPAHPLPSPQNPTLYMYIHGHNSLKEYKVLNIFLDNH